MEMDTGGMVGFKSTDFLRNPIDWLDTSDFVVYQHNSYSNGSRAKLPANFFRLNYSVCVGCYLFYLEPLFSEQAFQLIYGCMLKCGKYNFATRTASQQ